MRKRILASVFFTLLTLALTVFIFSNSLQVAEESSQKSDALVDIINSLFGMRFDAEILSSIIRKLGHFAEYFALGAVCSAAFAFGFDKKNYLVFSPLYCLLTAICDEFICQAITFGRSPELRDVFIDISGALLSTLAVLLLFVFLKKRSGRKGDKV